MGKKRVMVIGLDAADPVQCQRLMDEGKMPNLKKLRDQGVATKSMSMVGALPSVTPPNWCSIATGCLPRTHGVTCYNNQTLGAPLAIEELNWTSENVTADFIWEAFSKEGRRNIQLNYCESWPPRNPNDEYGVYIDGSGVMPFMRCNVDYQKVVILEEGDFPMEFTPHVIKSDNLDCVVMGDRFEEMKSQSVDLSEARSRWAIPAGLVAIPAPIEDLDSAEEIARNKEHHEESYRPSKADKIRSAIKDPTNWSFELPAGAKEAAITLASSTVRRHLVLTASDGEHYDTITVYKNKKTEEPLGAATGIGNWSEIIYDYYMVNGEPHKVSYAINLCDMAEDGSSAIIYFSHATDDDNLDYFYPREMGTKLYDAVGPLIQFASVDVRGDSRENDKLVFDTYAKHQTQWLGDAANWLFEEYSDWELFYVHLHSIDNFQHWFIQNTVPGRCDDYQYYRDLIDACYTENDKFIGRMMEHLDGDTSIIVVSDHGQMPHSAGDEYPGIGTIGGITTKVLKKLGYTVTKKKEDGTTDIDWSKTRAIARRSSYVYINLKGRDPNGIVEPEDYHQLVLDVISDMYNYRNEDGKRIFAHCFTRDEQEYLGMGGVHCGDILFQLVPTFNNDHANTFSTCHHEGWSMQNLCVMGGAGIKQGATIDRPIHITDIVPTICTLTGVQMPGNVEGGPVYQAFEGFEETKYDRGDEWAPFGRLIK